VQNDDPEFLSLNGLARRLDLNYRRAMALRDRGVLVPDCLGPNNIALFKVSRLSELRAAAAEPFGLQRSIDANVRAQTARNPRK